MVIDSLWLLACCGLNDKSKKMSVSHAKHWQIREICEIRVRPLSSSSMCKKLFVLFELFVFKKNSCSKKSRVQNDEWFKMMSGSFVVSE